MRRARVAEFVTVALVALATGCTQDNNTAGPTANEPLVGKLIELGYRGDMIEDRGDHFIIEGDIRMPKVQIQQLIDREHGLRPDFQYRTTNLVDQSGVQNINVSLAGISNQPAYLTAVRAAFVEWNRVNCSNVRFIEGGSPIRIRVVTYSGSSGTAALAKGPIGGGLPGDTLWINLNFGGPHTDLVRKRNMVHELGHTIGFRHTNWHSLGETAAQYGGAIHIPGTPTDPPGDPYSVMNGGNPGIAWTKFSNHDIKATNTLYPNTSPALCIRPNLSGPSQVWPYYTCTWRAAPTGGTPPYSYSWMNGSPVLNGSVFHYRNSGSSFSMGVTVFDANGRYAGASMPVTVYQYGPSCG